MKSKNKRGRPRTYRKPVLVRLDNDVIKLLNKHKGKRTIPGYIRYILFFYLSAWIGEDFA